MADILLGIHWRLNRDFRPMNKLAQRLGRMAKGVPKTYTQAELDRRTKRLSEARKKRWSKHRSHTP